MLKCNFRANFGDLSLGFDVKAPIPQGLTRSPNYFGLLNNLMTLIICESLREIGEMACVTSAWSSRGQTLKTINTSSIEIFRHLTSQSEMWFIQALRIVFYENVPEEVFEMCFSWCLDVF